MTNEEFVSLCCPLCGERLFPSSSVTVVTVTPYLKRLPVPGDATMCIHCSEILVFSNELNLGKPTKEELDIIKEDPDWPLMQKCVAFAKTVKDEEELTSFSA